MTIYDGTNIDVPVEITNNTDKSMKIAFLNISNIEIKPGETIKYKAKNSERLVELLYKLKGLGLDVNSNVSEDDVPLMNIEKNKKYSLRFKESINTDKVLEFIKAIVNRDAESNLKIINMEFSDSSDNTYYFGELTVGAGNLPITIGNQKNGKAYSYLFKDYFDVLIDGGMIEGYPEGFTSDRWYEVSLEGQDIIATPADINDLNEIFSDNIKVVRIVEISVDSNSTEVDQISSEDIKYVLSYLREYVDPLTVIIDEDPDNVGNATISISEAVRGYNFRELTIALGKEPYKYTLEGKDKDKLVINNVEDDVQV